VTADNNRHSDPEKCTRPSRRIFQSAASSAYLEDIRGIKRRIRHDRIAISYRNLYSIAPIPHFTRYVSRGLFLHVPARMSSWTESWKSYALHSTLIRNFSTRLTDGNPRSYRISIIQKNCHSVSAEYIESFFFSIFVLFYVYWYFFFTLLNDIFPNVTFTQFLILHWQLKSLKVSSIFWLRILVDKFKRVRSINKNSISMMISKNSLLKLRQVYQIFSDFYIIWINKKFASRRLVLLTEELKFMLHGEKKLFTKLI